MKNYNDLKIYQLAYTLALDVHKMSMTLPKYELWEQGGQVRRSSKSIKDDIVEGFGRRKYKNDFIRFLIFAQASCDESTSQLTMINEIHFTDKPISSLIDEYNKLGRMINKFIQYVELHWKT